MATHSAWTWPRSVRLFFKSFILFNIVFVFEEQFWEISEICCSSAAVWEFWFVWVAFSSFWQEKFSSSSWVTFCFLQLWIQFIQIIEIYFRELIPTPQDRNGVLKMAILNFKNYQNLSLRFWISLNMIARFIIFIKLYLWAPFSLALNPGFFLLISKFMSIIEWLSLCSVCCIFQNCKIGHGKFEKFQNHCSIGPEKPSSITQKKYFFFKVTKNFSSFYGSRKNIFRFLLLSIFKTFCLLFYVQKKKIFGINKIQLIPEV